MSKARIMGAGLAGSSLQGVNSNGVQFGNKLQGIPPSVGVDYHNNYNSIKSRISGSKRDVVFSVNQLGGIGRGYSAFRTNAGGQRIKNSYRYVN